MKRKGLKFIAWTTIVTMLFSHGAVLPVHASEKDEQNNVIADVQNGEMALQEGNSLDQSLPNELQAIYTESSSDTTEEEYTEKEYGYFSYREYNDHVEIYQCRVPSNELVFPSEINGLPVTAISIGYYGWSSNGKRFERSSITSVVIPDGVIEISDRAFERCTNLESIDIPDSVIKIGDSAFQDCTNLIDISIPDSVVDITSNDVFEGTAWLDNQPDGVVYAGKVVYDYKGTPSTDEKIVLKDGTRAISYRALSLHYSSYILEIPATVEKIGVEAIAGKAVHVVIDENNPYFTVKDDVIYTKDMKTMVRYCGDAHTLIIPNTVETVQKSAIFRYGGVSGMLVYIPKSVKKFGAASSGGYTYCLEGTEEDVPVVNSDGDLLTEENNNKFEYNCKYDDNFMYSGTDTLTVIGCIDNNAKELSIPSVVNGMPVVSIGADAFSANGDWRNIATVSIPTSIQKFEYDLKYEKVTGGYRYYYYNSLSYHEYSTRYYFYIHYDGTREQWYQIEGVEAFEKEPDFLSGFLNKESYLGNNLPKEFLGVYEGFNYVEHYDGIEINGYLMDEHINDVDEIIIPEEINGRTVNSISCRRVEHSISSICFHTKKLVIPATVTQIESDPLMPLDLADECIQVAEDNPNYSSKDGILYDKNKTTLLDYPYGIKSAEYTLPNTVTNIETDCNGYYLKEIHVSEKNTSFSSENGILYDKNKTTLLCYPRGIESEEYTLPDTVTNIRSTYGSNDLKKNKYLKAIHVSKKNTAFASENGVLYDKYMTEIICYPEGKTDAAFTVPSTVTSIGVNDIKYRKFTSITFENPECEIADYSWTICSDWDKNTGEYIFDGTIYGYDNSTAQVYAEKYGRNFESLGTAPIFETGDVSYDGSVSMIDIVLLQKYLLSAQKFTKAQLKLADMNQDNLVNIFDLVFLKQKLIYG